MSECFELKMKRYRGSSLLSDGCLQPRDVTPFICGEQYCAGQSVCYQGIVYRVKADCPQGCPGTSDDFCEICIGPAGPAPAPAEAVDDLARTASLPTVIATINELLQSLRDAGLFASTSFRSQESARC